MMNVNKNTANIVRSKVMKAKFPKKFVGKHNKSRKRLKSNQEHVLEKENCKMKTKS